MKKLSAKMLEKENEILENVLKSISKNKKSIFETLYQEGKIKTAKSSIIFTTILDGNHQYFQSYLNTIGRVQDLGKYFKQYVIIVAVKKGDSLLNILSKIENVRIHLYNEDYIKYGFTSIKRAELISNIRNDIFNIVLREHPYDYYSVFKPNITAIYRKGFLSNFGYTDWTAISWYKL